MNPFIIALLLWSTTTTAVTAAETKTIPCFMIAPFVATYGQTAVTDWAKAHGYSEAQIAEVIRRCKKKG